MPKQKRDYEKLKKEFMQSKFTDLSSFIATKGVPYNRHTREYMKGWAKEKKALKARATDRALKRVESKLAEKLEPSSEYLLGNISKAILLSGRKLEQMEEKDSISVKDLNTIWSMNRIQNGQPTSYVKEDQDVNQNVRIEGIHIIIGPNNIDNNKTDENNA